MSPRRPRDGDRDDGERFAAAPEPVRAAEAQLIELLPEIEGARLLCVSVGRAQLAIAAASRDSSRTVVAPFLDLHLAERARAAAHDAAAATAATVARAADTANIASPGNVASVADEAIRANLTIECVADLPPGPFDAAAIPLQAGGDSELAWDLLQQAFERLEAGGVLFAAVNEPKDRWVAGRMEALFGARIRRWPGRESIAYSGTKRGPLKKRKEFRADFAFRDRGRLIHVVTRPGVFSHRSLDLGARALIESLSADEARGGGELVAAGARVLDLGCGAGAVGFAAAFRAEGVTVHAIDSMPRALECARLGAERNGLSARHSTQLDASGEIEGGGTFDMVLANPPYYSRHAIAEVFVAGAERALRAGGRLHVVTRQPEWFLERMARRFGDVEARSLRTYAVVTGVRSRR